MEANVLAEPELNGQEDEQANQGKRYLKIFMIFEM